jgi:hypothetical protein
VIPGPSASTEVFLPVLRTRIGSGGVTIMH